MDVFKFNNPTAPTKMEQGVLVNGLTSKMWIERYLESGEFTFVAPASAYMRNALPIGSFISHVDTTEIMIVENHEIRDQKNEDADLVITGRGFETFFESRIVGSNKVFPTSDGVTEYVLSAGFLWDQAIDLITDHIYATNLIDDDDAIPYTTVMTDIVGVGDSVERSLKRADLYKTLLDLLPIENLGIKVVRPGIWSPLGVDSQNVAVVIHQGINRAAQIIFSHDTGEIETAEYLWSNKKVRNTAMVSGRWVETRVTTVAVGIARRMMFVDASDVDNQFNEAPTGVDLDAVIAAMQQRGLSALASQNEVALTRAEVSKDANRATYRKDFNVGDIITVDGDYNETSMMRISEYVEIEDKEGISGHPTLTLV